MWELCGLFWMCAVPVHLSWATEHRQEKKMTTPPSKAYITLPPTAWLAVGTFLNINHPLSLQNIFLSMWRIDAHSLGKIWEIGPWSGYWISVSVGLPVTKDHFKWFRCVSRIVYTTKCLVTTTLRKVMNDLDTGKFSVNNLVCMHPFQIKSNQWRSH